ncbi:DUF6924 domain-containing protein [Streptomyces glomeratus]|uniref:DUF6924 domain-containing protein n=1 Tax=Streptomyces glomeratus TaxID=284452 RepID=A0ABP6L7K5_9ACTN|nr:hypothetical protein [Streptomyces glomeratus]MCF1507176.1 hypothetical protein [Streptomyces glomeratus]
MTTETADLYVEDHDLQIDPQCEGIMAFPEHSDITNGIVGFHQDFGTILTGFERGWCHVTVQICPEPPALDAADWDDVLDVSADFARGQAFIGSYDKALTTNLAFDGPGTYRLRVHARGRAGAKDAALPRRPRPSRTNPAPETYLVQVWKAAARPEEVHKSSGYPGLPAAGYTGPTSSAYSPEVDAPQIRAGSGGIVLVRTCFTEPGAWQALLGFIGKGGEGGDCIDVTAVDERAYEGLSGEQLRSLVDRDEDDWPYHPVLLVADERALAAGDFPLLAVDNPPGEPAASFRITTAHLESFVVNMELGNTSFFEWSRDAGEDGVYTG